MKPPFFFGANLSSSRTRPVAILQAWRQHSCLEKAALKRAKTRRFNFVQRYHPLIDDLDLFTYEKY